MNNLINIGRLTAVVSFSLIVVVSVQSQVDSTQIIKDNILVTKSSKIETRSNTPYFQTIKYSETKTPKLKPTYAQSDYSIDLDRPKPVIKPIRHSEKNLKNSNDGLIKIGYGIPRALDAKLMYDYHIEDWYNLGISTGYSAANDIDTENLLYDQWHAKLYGGYWINPSIKVYTDLTLERHNQGLVSNFNLSAPLDDNLRNIHGFNASLGSSFSYLESKGIHFSLLGSYNTVEFLEENNQQQFISIGSNLVKTIVENLVLDIDFEIAQVKIKEIDNKTNYWLGSPSVRYRDEAWVGEMGVDILNNQDAFILWPRAQGEIYFEDKTLGINIASKMTADVIGLKAASNQNPYIHSQVFSPQTRIKKTVSAGINYHLKKHTFSFNLGNVITTNEVFYQASFSRLYNVLFTDKFNTFYININAKGSLIDWLEYRLESKYNFYDKTAATTPYLPQLHIDFSLMQSLFNDRLVLSESILLLSRNDSNVFVQTKDIIDLKVNAEYKLFPNFMLFIEGSNLLFQDYEIWEYYPIFQPKAIGGFKYLIN